MVGDCMVSLNLSGYCLARVARLPRFRGRKRLVRFLSRFVTSSRSAYGPRMMVQYSDATNQFALTASYGQYLPNLIRSMPADGAFIDIGANLGIFSLIAAEHLKRGVVISFEPNRSLFKQLLMNLDLNNASNVLPLNHGLGRECVVSYLSGDDSHSGLRHVGGRWDNKAVPPVLIGGADYTLFLKELIRGREALVKIDVEGAELEVLMALGASNVLEEVSGIYVEMDAANLARFGHTPELLYGYLAELDFTPQSTSRGPHYDEFFLRMKQHADQQACAGHH